MQNQVLYSGAKVDSLIGSANYVHMYPHSGLSQHWMLMCTVHRRRRDGWMDDVMTSVACVKIPLFCSNVF